MGRMTQALPEVLWDPWDQQDRADPAYLGGRSDQRVLVNRPVPEALWIPTTPLVPAVPWIRRSQANQASRRLPAPRTGRSLPWLPPPLSPRWDQAVQPVREAPGRRWGRSVPGDR